MTKTSTKAAAPEAVASTEVATFKAPGEIQASYLDALSQEASSGLQNIASKDVAIPFLTILQPLSPQISKVHPDYIPGAEAGDIFNTVTKKVSKTLDVVPVSFTKKLVEWKPRGSGPKSAPVAEYPDEDPITKTTTRNDKNQMTLPNGNILIETAYRFVLVIDPETGGAEPALIVMDSTDLTVSRQWNAKLMGLKLKRADGTSFTPPSFAQVFKAGSVSRQRDSYHWYNWSFDFAGIADEHIFKAGKDFHDSVSKGAVHVNVSAMQRADEATTEEVVTQAAGGQAPY